MAEGQSIVVGNVVIDADQFFAPRGRERHRLGERSKAAIHTVGHGNERLKGLTNRANGHRCGIWNLWAISSRAEVRKISGTLGNGRDVLSNCVGVLLPSPFLGEEEKGLSLFGVIEVRNVHRAADGVAEIVLLVRRVGVAWLPSRFPWSGVEEVVAQIFEGAAVEGTASRLRFHFDGA